MAIRQRLALATLGLGSLLLYLAMAVVGAQLLVAVWAQRPSTGVLVATIVCTALVVGLVSYWTGTARLRASLDARPIPQPYAPALYRRYDALTGRMNVGEPTLLVAQLPVPNAFAIGGSGAAI